MTNVTKNLSATKLKRLALSNRSREAKALREEMVMKATNQQDAEKWASRTINDIVMMGYKEECGAAEFNSFYQWKQKGFSVKKGEKAYLLWAKKRNATAKTEVKANEDPQEDDYMFYPLAYVFSDKQVEEIKEKEPDPEKLNEIEEYEEEYQD